MRHLLLVLLASFAIAAPAAAVDETPAPDTTSVAPDGVLYTVRGYAGTLPITTSEEAHAAVLAAGAPFAEFALLTDDLIGADSWYQAKGEVGSDAPWTIVYTYGWGDCPAGCISTHTFTYLVDPLAGAATFDSHQGDALPADAPEALVALTGRVTGEPAACPEGITEPTAPISSDTVLPCLLPDGSLFPMALEDGAGGDTDIYVPPELCAPGGNYAFLPNLCPESLPTPVDPVNEMEMTGAIIILGGFVLLLIFQALRPLLPERRAQRRQKGNLPRSQEKSSPLPFLLALSPILLVVALVFSMGLQLWELTGVVVALMAVFGALAVVGVRYALGVHIATEVVQNANDSGRFYLINRFVPSIDTFAGKVEVVQPPRKRRRTTKGGAKTKPRR